MLGFLNATKYFKNNQGIKIILDNTDFLVDGYQKVGILSAIGEGKSTLVKILSGVQKLDKGVLIRKGTSWSLGYSGAFHPFLTANENIKIIAQLHHLDPYYLSAFCQDFAELSDRELNYKIEIYSGNMKAKLGFAISLAIPCDYYLADEKLSVGDEDFRIRCEAALELKLEKSGLIFLSRNPKSTENICDHHGLLRNGKITMYESHEEASFFFNQGE